MFQWAAGLRWNSLGDSFRNTLSLAYNGKKIDHSFKLNTPPDTIQDNVYFKAEQDSVLGGQFKTWFPGNIIEDDVDKRNSFRLKDQFSLFPRRKDEFNLGAELSYFDYHIKNQNGRAVEGWYLKGNSPVSQDTIRVSKSVFEVDSGLSSWQAGGFAQYVFYYNHLKAVAGMRGEYYSLFEESAFSPRLALALAPPGLGTFSLTGGLFHQIQSRFTEELEWVLAASPEDNNQIDIATMALERNWQAILGYEQLIRDTWQLAAEVYVKFYDREYAMLNPWNFEFRADTVERGGVNIVRFKPPRGEKLAYGFEFQFYKKKYDKLYYSLAYSWFNVLNRYAEPAGNERWFDDQYNVRNTLSLLVGSNIRQHGIAFRVSASEGKPYSKMIIKENRWGNKYLIFDKEAGYFTERFKPMIAVHSRYSFRVYRSWGNVTGYVEVSNLLNSTPVIDRRFNGRDWQYDEKNGIVPVAGITIDF